MPASRCEVQRRRPGRADCVVLACRARCGCHQAAGEGTLPLQPRQHRVDRTGREVGEAYRFLLELRLDEGPLGSEAAEERLREWYAAR